MRYAARPLCRPEIQQSRTAFILEHMTDIYRRRENHQRVSSAILELIKMTWSVHTRASSSSNSQLVDANSLSISLVALKLCESPYNAAIRLPSTSGNSRCRVAISRSSALSPPLDISNCSSASLCSPRSDAGTKEDSSNVPARRGGWPGGGP